MTRRRAASPAQGPAVPRTIVPALAALVLLRSLLPAGVGAQPIEDHRFCDESATNVVLFLDVTTPYDEADRSTLVSGIEGIFDSLDDGDRISIRTIEDAFSSSDRLLDMCVPYCPSKGFFRDLFSNCTMGVVINERKRLRAAVKLTLHNRLKAARELPNSEIIRTISTAGKEEYRPDRQNQIYIFSDMIENSAYLSGRTFYSSEVQPLINRLKGDGLVPHLNGATVHVFGFGRTGVPSERAALDQEKLNRISAFWTAYFGAAGASLSMQQHLSGAS